MNYHPHKTAAEIFAEYGRFDEAHAKPLLPKTVVHANDPAPDRKLRVGYLSPDFREHAARHFLEPLLAHYDRSKVDLYCYAEVAQPDAVTASFKAMATEWRSTIGMSDEAVAAQIRADAIDILVDFGGHTSSSRLLVMARKPAPIQIAHYLGHGYTSGLSAVDVFMSDAEMAPEGSEHLFSERIVRLPRIPVAYVPPQGMPEVAELPALKKGHITFGYFGRPERLNERVVASWAKILKGVPNSVLMLNSKAFAEEAFCTLFADRFGAHGIGRDRLRMVYTSPQPRTWSAYGEVDIALDPYPHNAGTTTIEAMWLGVPVVSVLDRPSVGRFGISTLGAVGLEGLGCGRRDGLRGARHRQGKGRERPGRASPRHAGSRQGLAAVRRQGPRPRHGSRLPQSLEGMVRDQKERRWRQARSSASATSYRARRKRSTSRAAAQKRPSCSAHICAKIQNSCWATASCPTFIAVSAACPRLKRLHAKL